MAFRFKRKQSVSKGIRRVGDKRIERALECLGNRDPTAAIHGARMEIKKVRAVLRLVRHRMANKKFGRLNRILQKASAHLAAPRDAYVQVQALRDLAAHFRGQLAPGAFRDVRAERRRNLDAKMRLFTREKRGRTAKTLRRARKALAASQVEGEGWKAVGPGIKSTYRAGWRAYRTALRNPSPENFHAWRKRAKDLWYQVRLMSPIWPEQLEAMASELKALSQSLGDDHDLVVLRQSRAKRGERGVNPREWETLDGLIEERQRELQNEALALGARFYAETPAAFCDRLARYWKSWQRGEAVPVLSAETTA